MPTVAVTGVLPPGGITLNHVAVVGETVIEVMIGVPPLVICTVWLGGAEPLMLKVSDVGDAANVGVGGGGAAGVMVKVVAKGLPAELTPARLKVTVPTLAPGGVHEKANEEPWLLWRIY